MTLEFLQNGMGVFLVGKDVAHARELARMVGRYIDEGDIFLMEGGKSIFLTDEDVESGDVHDYKVVVTTIKNPRIYIIKVEGDNYKRVPVK